MIKNFLIKSPDFFNKNILVTGGTGSFGQHFIKTIIQYGYQPRRLIVFSRDELKQYEMALRFSTDKYPFMRYFIGDIRDQDRIDFALRDVDIVVHAASLKHVPIAEYNPTECIRTNIGGAENIVRASLNNSVQTVIALSTDKAVSPINIYGASKLAMEKIFIAANNIRGKSVCRFSVARYGNVVGSRGSVVPFFQKLVQQGAKSLPITDPSMTRFWITLSQGVDFVLSSIALMEGGEIFIPKIPSMKIIDMANLLAPKLEKHVIGIRPGEKLHEWMLTGDESYNTVEMDDRYVIFHLSTKKKYASYKGVKKNFCYASNTNMEWLHADDLKNMITF